MITRLRLLAGAIAVLSVSTVVPPQTLAPAYAAPTRSDYDDVVERLDRTRKLVQTLEKREKSLRSDIASGEARRRALEIELEEISAVVDDAQGKLAAAEAVLAGIQRELDTKTTELQAALQRLQERHDLLQARAVRVYMNGPASFFESVVAAESFADAVSRLQLVLRVFRSDESLVTAMRTDKARITKEREAVVDLRARATEQVDAVRRERDRVAAVERALSARRSAVSGELRGQYANLTDVKDRKEDYLRQQSQLEAESRRIAGFLKGRTSGAATVSQGGMAWPTSGPVTSGYGWRTHPIFGTRRFHSGIDIGAPSGQSVGAAAPGTVIFAGVKGGYGNTVIIDHGGGIATLYGHLSSISAGGGSVSGRQTVGRVGCTGYCTGPHLHFEVRVNGEPQNPMRWLG